jgi:MFS family permease
MAALASRMVAGRAMDIFGRKVPLAIGTVVFFIATPFYLVTTAIAPFMLVRLIHGLGFGIIHTGGSAIAADLAPEKRRGEAMGYFANANSIAMAVGPAIAVTLMSIQGLPLDGFQLVFVGCILLALVGLVSALLIRVGRAPAAKLSAGKTNWSIASFFCPAAVPPALAVIFSAFAAGAVNSFVPVYFAATSPQIIPVFFLVIAIVMTVTRPFLGRLSDRIERRRLLVPLFALCGAGMATLSVSPTLPVAIGVALVYGIGFGSIMPTLIAIVVDRVKPGERVAALATFMAAIDIGISLGSVVGGMIAQNFGLQTVFLGAGASCVLGIVYTLSMYGRLGPAAPRLNEARPPAASTAMGTS